MSMDEILKALLGGAGGQPQDTSPSGEDPLASLLGSLMGGGSGATAGGGQQAGGLDMGSLMQAILGGGAASQGGTKPRPSSAKPRPSSTKPRPSSAKPRPSQAAEGGLGDVLGAMLGGQGAAPGAGSSGISAMLSPIIEALAQKMGLPPVIAQAVVAFAIGKLLTGAQSRGAGQPFGVEPMPSQAAPSSGLNLDALLSATRSTGMELQPSPMSGLAEELSSYTGLDTRTAEQSLVTVFDMLGSQSAAPRQSTRRTRASAQSRARQKGS